jgi:disulfide bond formation protein DsbB|tara:strand:- start:286 stop:780 length:495 start_codon:yes stop_codon:yes gene_type:complete
MLKPNWLSALICTSSLLAVVVALISQYYFDMPPCAWCVFQRLLFLFIALWAGLAWLLGSQKVKNTFNILIILTSFGGVASATYQINVASKQFSCAQTFADIFMTRSGLESALPELFGIYATCADARVTVLGVEYAVWAILLFSLQAITATLTLYLSCRLPRNPN